MISNVVAIVVTIAVVTGLFGALYGWFEVLGPRLHGATAKDVLTSGDAEIAELQPPLPEGGEARAFVGSPETVLRVCG